MEVADTIVVMDEGRIEQVGSPRELYEEPANEFVMTFVGPTTRLGGSWVRPHDIELASSPNGGTSTAAQVERLVHLGVEVRVELRAADGGELSAQVTRDAADELGLKAGDQVYLVPRRAKVFSTDER